MYRFMRHKLKDIYVPHFSRLNLTQYGYQEQVEREGEENPTS
jgi:hypothetical protein